MAHDTIVYVGLDVHKDSITAACVGSDRAAAPVDLGTVGQPLQWFADKDSVLFCDFLMRWPTAKAARQARRATLEKFFYEHNVRQPKLVDQRINAIKSAVAIDGSPQGVC